MEIKKPIKNDLPKLEDFFRKVITDTAKKEGITIINFIEEEVEKKLKYCRNYFEEGNNISILLAIDGEKIIGSISSSYCNLDIQNVIKDLKKDSIKIGTVYIHPSYQRKGLGKNY